MLFLVVVILLLAVVAGYFGVSSLSLTFTEIAVIFFVGFLVIMGITLLFRRRR